MSYMKHTTGAYLGYWHWGVKLSLSLSLSTFTAHWCPIPKMVSAWDRGVLGAKQGPSSVVGSSGPRLHNAFVLIDTSFAAYRSSSLLSLGAIDHICVKLDIYGWYVSLIHLFLIDTSFAAYRFSSFSSFEVINKSVLGIHVFLFIDKPDCQVLTSLLSLYLTNKSHTTASSHGSYQIGN